MAIGVVVGMLSEARLLDGLGFTIVAGGGHAEVTRRKADALAASGATALVSFGIAGALDPALKPGDLIIPESVITPDGRCLECDSAWRQSAIQKVAGQGGAIAGRSIAAATREEKGILFRETAAVAVDMESHHVAEAASRHGLPFLVIRAVADTAQDTLPEAALKGLNEEGRPAIAAVLQSLLRKPWQLPRLIRVALRSRTAMNALLRGRAGLL